MIVLMERLCSDIKNWIALLKYCNHWLGLQDEHYTCSFYMHEQRTTCYNIHMLFSGIVLWIKGNLMYHRITVVKMNVWTFQDLSNYRKKINFYAEEIYWMEILLCQQALHCICTRICCTLLMLELCESVYFCSEFYKDFE